MKGFKFQMGFKDGARKKVRKEGGRQMRDGWRVDERRHPK